MSNSSTGPVCQHTFHDLSRAHYCDYIGVPGLLETFYAGATTLDEILLCSGLYAYTLWWNLQEKELTALNALVGTPLGQTACYEAIKRANRCVEVGRIMLQQGIILRSELLRRKAHFNFRLSDDNPRQLGVFERVARLTRRLEQGVGNFRLSAEVDTTLQERLLDTLKDMLLTHADQAATTQRDFTELLWAIHEQPAGRVVELSEVLPEARLLSFGQETLTKQHPQAASPTASHDELTFVTAHQAFEVWFPSVIRSIQTATKLLQARPAQVWESEALARRIADIFALFGRMIHIPQTMTAADYIEFRDQLEAGSGVESYQFRAIEISAGLRDERYRRTIAHMHLLTPDLQLLWDAPSLNTAVMTLLLDRGLIQAEDGPSVVAQKLARILLPTSLTNSDVDLAALAEALVRFEQNVELWRTDHIAMVTRMIGRKSGTGAQTYGQLAEANAEAVAARYDSLPYLYNTLKYQKIFPALWDARDHLLNQPTFAALEPL